MTSYQRFLAKKTPLWTGEDAITGASLPSRLFDWQAAIVRWALKKGRAAIWADTGLGKTAMQLAWANAVAAHTGGKVLVLTPLAVGAQTVREAAKFGIDASLHRDGVDSAVTILNYERLHQVETSAFAGVVLDESSILKAYMGATKQRLIEAFKDAPYRLCCTATPAPNDHLELGNHAQFLGVMESHEMIMRWFINDSMVAGGYRLKPHGAAEFWRWVASWAVSLTSPTDLGFDGSAFVLPALHTHHLDVGYVDVAPTPGQLFANPRLSATDLHATMRATAHVRAQRVADLIAADPDEAWLVWAHTNYDAAALAALMPDIVDVRGSDSVERKQDAAEWFVGDKCVCNWPMFGVKLTAWRNDFTSTIATPHGESGDCSVPPAIPESDSSLTVQNDSNGPPCICGHKSGRRYLLCKPSAFGFGMNWQHCARVVFLGVSYSFEQFYQAIRRTWRFGQTRPVEAYIVSATNEYAIVNTLTEKEAAHRTLKAEMLTASRASGVVETSSAPSLVMRESQTLRGQTWELTVGDCVPAVEALTPSSVQLSVFSPPFSNLYIYSDAIQDMGNSTDHREFFEHFGFLASALLRATALGRLCAIHCKDLPLYKGRDGAAGLFDFPGAIIAAMSAAGWTYHSRVTIWKDPVIEMQRTKNHGLLYKQLRKDSSASRMGMADFVVAFRKWPAISTNEPFPDPVPHDRADFPLERWQAWASPVWSDIRQTNVLKYTQARAEDDERHICPLQLDVIERCIELWSNPGDLVCSPFAGIGSEGYEAIRLGRRFVGMELKPEYAAVAAKNLALAETLMPQGQLFTDEIESVASLG